VAGAKKCPRSRDQLSNRDRTIDRSGEKKAALILKFPEQAFHVLPVKRLCLSQCVEKLSGIHRVVAVAVHFRNQRLLSRDVLIASGYVPFSLGKMPQQEVPVHAATIA